MGGKPKRLAGAFVTQREAGSLAGLSGNAQTVYFHLRVCVNARTGKTPPIGYPLLVSCTGLSRDKIKRALAELKRGGYIVSARVNVGGFARCVYRFPKALRRDGP